MNHRESYRRELLTFIGVVLLMLCGPSYAQLGVSSGELVKRYTDKYVYSVDDETFVIPSKDLRYSLRMVMKDNRAILCVYAIAPEDGDDEDIRDLTERKDGKDVFSIDLFRTTTVSSWDQSGQKRFADKFATDHGFKWFTPKEESVPPCLAEYTIGKSIKTMQSGKGNLVCVFDGSMLCIYEKDKQKLLDQRARDRQKKKTQAENVFP